jgi:hypothetical protein
MDRPDMIKQTTRRNFVKAGLASGAIVTGAALLKVAPTVAAAGAGYPQYGSYLVWFDSADSNFRKTNLKTGLVEGTPGPDAATVIQEAINLLPANDANGNSIGGEVWLSTDINATSGIITIDRSQVSLLAMHRAESRSTTLPRPHIQKIKYSGQVKGGVLQGIHCREIQFDGTGNQEQMTLYDISMAPTGIANQQGLRFSDGVGYMQYISIHDLNMNLSGTSPIAVEFASRQNPTGHITFGGQTIVEVDGAGGSPVIFQFTSGVGVGTPIRIDNLSVIDFGTGTPTKTVYVQPQATIDRGVVQMYLGRFFFEQHNTSQPANLVTIDAATTGFDYFGLTIDELAVTVGGTVNIINNANTAWMSGPHQQLLRVNAGRRFGTGTLAIGTPNQHTAFRVYLGQIRGLTPFGKINTPFVNLTNQFFCGAGGTSSSPSTSVDYIVGPTPVLIAIQSGFGPLTIKDPLGNVVKTVNATSASLFEAVPTGYTVQFGSSGGITVYGT